MAMNISPKAVGLSVVAIGALWYIGKMQARQNQVRGVAASKNQDYANPVAVANLLGNALAIFTKGAKPAPVQAADAKPNPAAITVASANEGIFGSNLFGWASGGLSASPLDGWAAPNVSRVASPSVSGLGLAVDSVVAAPVYDIGTDFTNNPFALAGL